MQKGVPGRNLVDHSRSRRRKVKNGVLQENKRQDVVMKTIFVKPATMEKKWYLIDAEGKNLGRVAVEAARILRGKN